MQRAYHSTDRCFHHDRPVVVDPWIGVRRDFRPLHVLSRLGCRDEGHARSAQGALAGEVDYAPGGAGAGLCGALFPRVLNMPQVPKSFRVCVSADERYRLLVNGVEVVSGPARGDLLNWRYETVDLAPVSASGQ